MVNVPHHVEFDIFEKFIGNLISLFRHYCPIMSYDYVLKKQPKAKGVEDLGFNSRFEAYTKTGHSSAKSLNASWTTAFWNTEGGVRSTLSVMFFYLVFSGHLINHIDKCASSENRIYPEVRHTDLQEWEFTNTFSHWAWNLPHVKVIFWSNGVF